MNSVCDGDDERLPAKVKLEFLIVEETPALYVCSVPDGVGLLSGESQLLNFCE
jgi:hypothetical protein